MNREFQALHREANEFRAGKFDYSRVLGWSAVTWKFLFIGIFAVTFMANSMLTDKCDHGCYDSVDWGTGDGFVP